MDAVESCAVQEAEQRLEQFRATLRSAWPDGDGEKPLARTARLYHRRQVGGMCFFDALMIDPSSKESFIAELVTCSDRNRCRDGFETAVDEVSLKDLRMGDVVEICAASLDPAMPRPPCHVTLQVFHLRRLEAWLQLFGKVEMPHWAPAKYGFHRPIFHDAVNQSWFDHIDRQQKAKQEKKKSKDGAEAEAEALQLIPATSKWGSLRRPRAILQCQLPHAERLAEYFGGRILSSCSRDRLVMIYHEPSEETLAARHAELIEGKVPSYLQSVIQRIYFVDTTRKAISLQELCTDYLKAVCPKCGRWDFLRRARNLITFPRDLEDVLGPMVDAQVDDAAGDADDWKLPKEQCDSIVYADGLFWWSIRAPRAIIPERSRSVPSGAYWKLLEILARYRPQQLGNGYGKLGAESVERRYTGRRMALDVGASPGGWSYCLAQRLCTCHVIACDPAAYMHPLVRRLSVEGDRFVKDFTAEEQKEDEKQLKYFKDHPGEGFELSGKISHWRMRGEEALQKLQADALADASRISLFVCDMNDALETSCELLYRIFQERLYEAPCLAVVTFKNTCKSKAEFHERKRKMIARIIHDGVLTQLQEIHLFANTRMETTIVGEMR